MKVRGAPSCRMLPGGKARRDEACDWRTRRRKVRELSAEPVPTWYVFRERANG